MFAKQGLSNAQPHTQKPLIGTYCFYMFRHLKLSTIFSVLKKRKYGKRKTCLGVSTSYVSALLLIFAVFIRFANSLCFAEFRTVLFNPTQCETLRVFRHSARGAGFSSCFFVRCFSTCLERALSFLTRFYINLRGAYLPLLNYTKFFQQAIKHFASFVNSE